MYSTTTNQHSCTAQQQISTTTNQHNNKSLVLQHNNKPALVYSTTTHQHNNKSALTYSTTTHQHNNKSLVLQHNNKSALAYSTTYQHSYVHEREPFFPSHIQITRHQKFTMAMKHTCRTQPSIAGYTHVWRTAHQSGKASDW